MKTTMKLRVQSMREGIATVLPTNSSLLVEGTQKTQPDLLKELDGFVALFAAVDQDKQKLLTSRSTLKTDGAPIHALMLGLAKALRQQFGSGSPQLPSFGLAPQGTRKASTPQVKLLANAKRTATRSVRHVMGTRQRAAIVAPAQNLEVLLVDADAKSAPAQATPPPAK